MQTREITQAAEWDTLIHAHPQAHPLQTWGWGEVKQASGWGANRFAILDDDGRLRAGAQVLTRKVPHTPFSMIYIPRGPIMDPTDEAGLMQLMEAVNRYGRSAGAIFCKVDPAWFAGTEHALATAKFSPADEYIQVTETYTIDLTLSLDDIEKKMRSKTRQYMRKGEREGVRIERDVDGRYLDTCYQIYTETSRRAHFGLHPRSYYEDIFRLYDPARQYLYVAFHDETPLSFLWMACAGKYAVELYGGVSDAGQDYKANFTMKYFAIREMREAGYAIYDLNGRVNDGISQFKTGFGPDETSWIGPFDRVYNPVLYQGWTRALPFAKKMLTRSGSDRDGGE